MPTWVITYCGADRQEQQLLARASGTLTEQGAAMIVSNFLRLPASANSTPGNECLSITEQYNFQIIGIRKDPDDPAP